MKKLLYISLLFCLAQSGSLAETVSVTLIEESGKPIAEAEVTVRFQSIKRTEFTERTGKTDATGSIQFTDSSSFGLEVSAKKLGYYSVETPSLLAPHTDLELIFEMRQVEDPTQLFAVGEHTLVFPAKDQPLGFDLKESEWLPPFGNGKIADLYFTYSAEFTGFSLSEEELAEAKEYSRQRTSQDGEEWSEEEFQNRVGNWSGRLRIDFDDSFAGINENSDEYHLYSALRLPAKAPIDEYQTSMVVSSTFLAPISEMPDRGYFIRSRIQRDEDGEVIGSNYSKINRNIHFDPRGYIVWDYYFNSITNSRNLEFSTREGSKIRKAGIDPPKLP